MPQEEGEAFTRSRELFERLVAALADPACDRLAHHQLEDLLSRYSGQLVARMLEEHADLHRRAGGHPGPA